MNIPGRASYAFVFCKSKLTEKRKTAQNYRNLCYTSSLRSAQLKIHTFQSYSQLIITALQQHCSNVSFHGMLTVSHQALARWSITPCVSNRHSITSSDQHITSFQVHRRFVTAHLYSRQTATAKCVAPMSPADKFT